MARLFVAAWPPDDLLDRVAALPRPDQAGLRWTGRHQWHVTLRFLGRVDDVGSAARAVTTAADGVLEAVEAVLGPAVGRFGSRVLHVPVTGLDRVAGAVVAATAHLGQPPDDRPFSGHLTLARVAPGARVDLARLTGTPIAGGWPVGEICLVESRLSAAGPTYQVVARAPIGRRQVPSRSGRDPHLPGGGPRTPPAAAPGP
ncbi:MAG: RNA 2',3'-cyclic phosphodiesterase [Acidimicrobiales bacterium]